MASTAGGMGAQEPNARRSSPPSFRTLVDPWAFLRRDITRPQCAIPMQKCHKPAGTSLDLPQHFPPSNALQTPRDCCPRTYRPSGERGRPTRIFGHPKLPSGPPPRHPAHPHDRRSSGSPRNPAGESPEFRAPGCPHGHHDVDQPLPATHHAPPQEFAPIRTIRWQSNRKHGKRPSTSD